MNSITLNLTKNFNGSDRLTAAFALASLAHMGQKDKSGAPYILHPVAVSEQFSDENEKIIALLHDVVEDTEVQLHQIYTMFGTVVGDAVGAVSRQEIVYPEINKPATKEKYFDFIKRCAKNRSGRKVKLMDIEHNSSPERYWKDSAFLIEGRYNKAKIYIIQEMLHDNYIDDLEFLLDKKLITQDIFDKYRDKFYECRISEEQLLEMSEELKNKETVLS